MIAMNITGRRPMHLRHVDLEHVLGNIETNRGNLHVDGSLM